MVFAGYSYLHENCTITPEDVIKAENSVWSNYVLWMSQNVFLCEKKGFGFFDTSISLIKEMLGFDENFYDFIPDLILGGLVGAWIALIYFIATLEKFVIRFTPLQSSSRYLSRLHGSWLGFIGNSVWKIIPIAVGYAVLMQIPVINRIIQVITFEPLLSYKGWWGYFIQSFIIAFYIGFLPMAIEQYSRYKIRKRYYHAIEHEKAVVAIDKIHTGG
ncbi:hypothetical protein KKH26_01920 [Patescibacteria group bacterium]|nr:hypothetical protein [Patescibacteria group bacterium]